MEEKEEEEEEVPVVDGPIRNPARTNNGRVPIQKTVW